MRRVTLFVNGSTKNGKVSYKFQFIYLSFSVSLAILASLIKSYVGVCLLLGSVKNKLLVIYFLMTINTVS